MKPEEALKLATEAVEKMATNSRGYQDGNGDIEKKTRSILDIARFLLNEGENTVTEEQKKIAIRLKAHGENLVELTEQAADIDDDDSVRYLKKFAEICKVIGIMKADTDRLIAELVIDAM